MEIQRQSEAFAYRLAMPAPLPQNITFKYHPDDSTIEGTMAEGVFYAPAVSAHIGNDPDHIGYISWFGDDYLDPDEVSMIEVDPHYRRSGVATALFDHAKKMNPKVHHSTDQTDLGHSWSDYEQSRKTKAANTIRCAYEMFKPSSDPYYFDGYDFDPKGEPDDPVLEDLQTAWIAGDGMGKRKPHIQRGAEMGPASPDENLTPTEQWLRNMGHEFASRISQSGPTNDRLYRGMLVPQEWIDNAAKTKSISLPLSSFDLDPETAGCYTLPDPGRSSSPRTGLPVFLRLAPGAQAYHLLDTEHITHGDFDITNMRPITLDEDDEDDLLGANGILMDITHRSLPQRKLLSNNTIRCAADDDLILYHGTGADSVPHIQQNGLMHPPGVSPAGWPMLTTDFDQAKAYATRDNPVVLEYHVPANLTYGRWRTHRTGEEPYLWDAEPHTAYDYPAQSYALKRPLPATFLRAVHPVNRKMASHNTIRCASAQPLYRGYILEDAPFGPDTTGDDVLDYLSKGGRGLGSHFTTSHDIARMWGDSAGARKGYEKDLAFADVPFRIPMIHGVVIRGDWDGQGNLPDCW
mgnify:FL=1